MWWPQCLLWLLVVQFRMMTARAAGRMNKPGGEGQKAAIVLGRENNRLKIHFLQLLGAQICDSLLNLRKNHSTMDIQLLEDCRIAPSNSLQFCFGGAKSLPLFPHDCNSACTKKKNSTCKIFKTENMKFHVLRNLHYLI